jgi:hypothetical protein
MDGEGDSQGLFQTVPVLVLKNAQKVLSVIAGAPAKVGAVSPSVVQHSTLVCIRHITTGLILNSYGAVDG